MSPGVYFEVPVQHMLAYEKFSIFKADSPGIIDYVGILKELLSAADARLPSETDLLHVCKRLQRIYGEKFSEEHLLRHALIAAKKLELEGKPAFSYEDFFEKPEERTAFEELSGMPGLANIKKELNEFAAMVGETMRNPKLRSLHNNLIFYGDPGSGKTVTARLTARMMAEYGGTSGAFIEADRASLIGKYLGHTAPKIKEKFQQAKGGVLFVDEAGFFIKAEGDKFSSEAIKEFIRYMECYPDVTVIFAMYRNEVKDFLALDEGLRSRITKMIRFENYSTEELADIVTYILGERGYALSKGCRTQLLDYLCKCDKSFGNGRGARKLADAIVLEHSIRNMKMPAEDGSFNPHLTTSEIRGAIRRFDEESRKGNESKRPIGFATKSVTCPV
jgi:SpoVK/Ycf46/Vps4 family AAA+-type ATPase